MKTGDTAAVLPLHRPKKSHLFIFDGKICKHQVYHFAIAADALGLSGGLDEGIVGLAAQLVGLGSFEPCQTVIEHLQIVTNLFIQYFILLRPCRLIG